MTDHDRHRAFRASAVVVVLVTTLIGVLSTHRSATPRATVEAPRRVVVGGRAAADGPRAGPAPPVLAAARRFAAAFTLYEVGRLTPSITAQLRRVATPALAADLLGDPPSTPAGIAPPSPATVESVALTPGATPTSAAVAVTLSRDGRLSPLTLTLIEDGQGWKISALR